MTKKPLYDAAIVGAGILGIAHAYLLARQGKRVVLLEKGPSAQGASVRNFGMVWPIGQPPGELRDTAVRSRQIWMNFLVESGLWHQESGSMHLAYAEDEFDVMSEFAERAATFDYKLELLSPQQVLKNSPHIRREELVGGLYSPEEVCVFPRQVIAQAPRFLAESCGVDVRFETAVTHVETGRLLAGGSEVLAEQIYLCTGDDYETLFPGQFAASGLTRSKLQMLRARPKSPGFQIGTHLCAGLTLAHYANFRITDRLAGLIERFHQTWPDQMRNGIHLLVSQHEDGLLTIGDSHHYGLHVDPFMSQEIEDLMLSYLDTFLPVENLDVVERWYGVYSKHPEKPYFMEDPLPQVHLLTGVGGAGMTLSFGISERHIGEVNKAIGIS